MYKSTLLLLFLSLSFSLNAQNWSNEINTRLITWLEGEEDAVSDSLVKERILLWEEQVKLAHKNLAKLDLNDYTPYVLDSSKKEQAELRGIFSGILYQLVSSYSTPDWLDQPNPDYQSPILADSIYRLFNYFNAKGWNQNAHKYVVRDTSQFSYLGFLPVGGTMGNNFGGYAISVWRFKAALKDYGIFDREMETLNSATFFLQPSYYGPGFDFPGFNSDGVRSFVANRLWYILALDEETDFVSNLDFLKFFLEKGLSIAPGLADMIKPDFSGFHHKHIYANAYAPYGYQTATIVAWMLRGTPWEIDAEKLNNLSEALLTSRIMAQKYDITTAITGRFPYNLNTLIGNIQSFIFLADCLPARQAELMSAAKRLLNPYDSLVYQEILQDYGVGSSIRSGLLSMQKIESLKVSNTILPEEDPQGFWFYPYGGLSIYRKSDWMVSMKGQSRYIIDFEGNPSQNVFGKNLSAGSLSLYTNGVPVDSESSGYIVNGYDWNRVPGVTALYYDSTDFPKPKLQRHLSSPSYNGAVSVNAYGASALEYEDINSSLKAHKSYFFLDNMILCLGSDIYAAEDTNQLITSLFQVGINDPRKDENRLLDSSKQSAEGSVMINDGIGNYFFIPEPANLRTYEGMQRFPNSANSQIESGYFKNAWFDHAHPKGPHEAASYQYLVLVQPDDLILEELNEDSNDIYEVVRQDSLIHAVYFPQQKLLMANFFSVDTLHFQYRDYFPAEACLMLVEERNDHLNIAIENPDLGWYDHYIPKDILFNDPQYLYAESPTQYWDLFVSGKCLISQGNGIDTEKQEAGLLIHLITQDAQTISFSLQCDDIGLDETFAPNKLEELRDLGPIGIYNMQGKLCQQFESYPFSFSSLRNGAYIAQALDPNYAHIKIKFVVY